MRRATTWIACVMAAGLAITSCREGPTEPAVNVTSVTAPQFDLVNMPAGQFPLFDFRDFVDIVDENGNTIWQDALQPTAGASFVLERNSPAGFCSVLPWEEFCHPIANFLELHGDPQECSMPPFEARIVMYHAGAGTCFFEAVRTSSGYVFQAGEVWRVTAAPVAPGGRYFRRTEISMIELNGDPARQVLPCAEGAVSPVCTVTLPQYIDETNHPQFRVHYGLAYPFGGFLTPVDPAPTVNMAKAGASIPVKFSLGSNLGLNILAAESPTSVPVACSASSSVDVLEETAASSNSGLHYDAATNQYVYVWKTQKAWAGTCREFRLAFTDNAPAQTAIFQFTK